MILAFCSVVLLFLFIYPFLPGIKELRVKEDADPLFIEMDYTKSPCYFANSFRKILLDALGNNESKPGVYQLNLSKSETVQVSKGIQIEDHASPEHILYINGDLRSGKEALVPKEVYVQGNATIGQDNHWRSLVCAGNVHLHQGTIFDRWLHADGSIQVEPQCQLGICTSSRQTLSLSDSCSFRRLYGFPIIVGKRAKLDAPAEKMDLAASEAAAALAPQSDDDELDHVETTQPTIDKPATLWMDEDLPPYTIKKCNIITPKTFKIGEHSVITGDIKSRQDLILGANVTVNGNIFADGNIHLGPAVKITGTVFTHGSITIEENVTIGVKGKIKTVIARKGITLKNGFVIYGYVMTEGTGIVS
ncbi:MAG TPA: polymer-forming cytoskeletal protein [Firmicutes bacterium]|jgi:cytoskeletal protein CcmA (bactofilin family)|nr:polymer-forming cytoskeletal protein [Bacillota bacterium]HPT66850.1 polymer-forming cytoskeletal protein [Bacillota bacterium]